MTNTDTTSPTLTQDMLKDGVWEGTLTGWEGDEAPLLYLLRTTEVLAHGEATPQGPGKWHVRFQLPGALIGNGAQAFSIVAEGNPVPLAQITLLAGDVLADDLYAEVAQLRDEVEVIKRSLRRHVRDVEARLQGDDHGAAHEEGREGDHPDESSG